MFDDGVKRTLKPAMLRMPVEDDYETVDADDNSNAHVNTNADDNTNAHVNTNADDNTAAHVKKICAKCGQLKVAHPKSIDWSTSVSAKTYCEVCYAQIQQEMNLLVNTEKAKKKQTKKKSK